MPQHSRAADPKHGRFMKRYLEASELDTVESLVPLANELEITLSQLALAWCLRDSGISSVIVGATDALQIAENSKASGLTLPQGVIDQIDDIFSVADVG